MKDICSPRAFALQWGIQVLLALALPTSSATSSGSRAQDPQWEYDYSASDEEWYDVSDWLDSNDYDGAKGAWYENGTDTSYDYYDDGWDDRFFANYGPGY